MITAALPHVADGVASQLPSGVVLDGEGGDLRGWRATLLRLLANVEPPVMPVPATRDRTVAREWWRQGPALGLEGLVIKNVNGVYRGGRRDWLKVKHDCVGATYGGTSAASLTDQ